MVCLGNICRSPIAEGVMEALINKNNLNWEVSSTGTSGWHIGEKPDNRSIDIAKKKGIDISKQRSSKLSRQNIIDHKHILVMDSQNYNDVLVLCETQEEKNKVELLLNYSYPNMNRAVPDPYYNGGFEKVYDLVEEACMAFVEQHQ